MLSLVLILLFQAINILGLNNNTLLFLIFSMKEILQSLILKVLASLIWIFQIHCLNSIYCLLSVNLKIKFYLWLHWCKTQSRIRFLIWTLEALHSWASSRLKSIIPILAIVISSSAHRLRKHDITRIRPLKDLLAQHLRNPEFLELAWILGNWWILVSGTSCAQNPIVLLGRTLLVKISLAWFATSRFFMSLNSESKLTWLLLIWLTFALLESLTLSKGLLQLLVILETRCRADLICFAFKACLEVLNWLLHDGNSRFFLTLNRVLWNWTFLNIKGFTHLLLGFLYYRLLTSAASVSSFALRSLPLLLKSKRLLNNRVQMICGSSFWKLRHSLFHYLVFAAIF